MRVRSFVVDGHNDLLQELVYRKADPNPFRQHWLPKLRQGGVRLQVCPIFIERARLGDALQRGLEYVVAFHRAARENVDAVRLVETRNDLERLRGTEELGLMLAIEGAEALGQQADIVDVYWKLGVRMVGLTWNYANAFASGNAERPDMGLTSAGKQLLGRLGELGVILDLAHASRATLLEALDHGYPGRLLVSHGCCRGAHDIARNLADDELAALADAGGMLGIAALPFMVDPVEPSLDRLVDHIDHAVGIMGVDKVGIGSDFLRQLARSGLMDLSTAAGSVRPAHLPPDGAIEGLEGPEDFGNLAAKLEARGYSAADVDAIMGGNLLRLISEALPEAHG